MTHYLYGAAVQGIQQYIFRVNDLKSIVQASNEVKFICTGLFESLLKKHNLKLEDEERAVINAAGNIKYIFDSREICEQVVREFPKMVQEYDPGITVSQAVVKYDGELDFLGCGNMLEDRLRTQRNKPVESVTLGLMGIRRSQGTNLPCFLQVKESAKDAEGSFDLNCDAFGLQSDGSPWVSVLNTSEMNDQNSWIAVIHADGNGLGQIVQEKLSQGRKAFLDFSRKLDRDTKSASRRAFEQIQEQTGEDWSKGVPIRPIVLGGDDFSVICRADLAIRYINYFLEAFEQNSGLTACAGIAFVKESFPFYYAYELAESLCSQAKKEARTKDEPAKSSLMYHKVQDSFVTDYKDIIQRELTPNEQLSFKFGPYYLREPKPERWTIEKLLNVVDEVVKNDKEGNAVKSRLRHWMTLLHENPQLAEQELGRIKQIYPGNLIINSLTKPNEHGEVPVYDVLTLHTLNTQTTKIKNENEQ